MLLKLLDLVTETPSSAKSTKRAVQYKEKC